MRYLNLATSALTLVSGIVATSAASATSSITTLIGGIEAHNTAINSTVAAYRANTISLDLARTYIRGNGTAISSTLSDVTKSLPTSGIFDGLLNELESLGYTEYILAGALGNYFQNIADSTRDALAEIQSIPGLDPPSDPLLPLFEIEDATVLLLFQIVFFGIFRVNPT